MKLYYVALNIALFLLAGSTVLHPLQAQVNKSAFLSAANHTWMVQEAEMTNLPEALLFGTNGDFDADGYEDVIVGDFSSVYVAWNSPTGLGAWKKLKTSDGSVNKVVWDEVSRTLWLQYSAPDRIEAAIWEDRVLEKAHAFNGAPRTITPCRGVGMVALRRQGNQLELLKPNGQQETLIQNASDLLQAHLWEDGEEERLLAVQSESTQSIGFIRYHEGTWQPPVWLEETSLTQHWSFQPDVCDEGKDESTIHFVGSSFEGLWYKRFNITSGVIDLSWEPSIQMGEVAFTLNRPCDGDRLQILAHDQMTHALSLYELNAESGVVEAKTALHELAYLPFALHPDLNGDGNNEWLYPLVRQNRFAIVTDWSRLTQRWVLRNPADSSARPWKDLGRLAQGWHDELESLEGVEEVWMDRGILHAKDSTDAWWTVSASAPGSMEARGTRDENLGRKSHQLVIPFLELGELGNWDGQAGVAEVEPGTWHHVAFSRNEQNQTRIWFDSKLVFQGKSKDLNYYYNSILVGAYLGSHWDTYGDVSVDQITLSSAEWTNEEVAQLAQPAEDIAPGRYTERWEFEDEEYTSERRKRPVVKHSAPSLTRGFIGNAALFDGKDDAVQTYLAVPQKGVSLSFHFRMNARKPERPHTITTLYGMFNTWFNVVYQAETYSLENYRTNGTFHSPVACKIEPAEFGRAKALAVIGDEVFAIDSTQALYQRGPLGWESVSNGPEGFDGPLKATWAVDDALMLLTEDQQLFSWDASSNWIQLGTVEPELTQAIATGAGLLHRANGQWGWHTSPLTNGRPLNAPAFDILDVVTSPIGTSITDNDGISNSLQSIHIEDGARLEPLVSASNRELLLIVGAVAVLLLAILAARKNRHVASGSKSFDLPQPLQKPLMKWIEKEQDALDANGLDEILSESPNETEETRRGRRSRFIREMNSAGQRMSGADFIVREKDPYDRRRVVYRLSEELIEAWGEQVNG